MLNLMSSVWGGRLLVAQGVVPGSGRTLVWLHQVSDSFIAVSFFSISIALWCFIRRRKDVAFQNVFLWFVGFIFACGVTHLLAVWTNQVHFYRVDGVVKAITACVSAYTAVSLWPMLPKLLALPSPVQLEMANRELAHQIEEREQADERIRNMNAELESRVQQRTEELRHSNDENRARNSEIEQFIYTVSHDLKSPLVTVQGFAGLLERDAREGRIDRLVEFAQQIKGGVAQMADLIDDLLDLSRIGRVAKPAEAVDLADLTNRIVQLHHLELDRRRVVMDVQDDMPVVNVDKERIAEVIENLLSNAIKFGCTGQSPRIRVGGRVTADEVQLFVEDNGPGIAERYHQKIFDLFERLDLNAEGTGVGLTIVKRAMEVHGGRVWVESTPGSGATFWLAFPKTALVQTADSAAVVTSA